MKIEKVLMGLEYEVIIGNKDVEINDIGYDSRKMGLGDMFFCITGFALDGHNFIKDVVDKGAKAVVIEKDIKDLPKDCTVIKVKDGRKALAAASSNFYGNPKDKLKIIGITGTNGKTTSTFMIKHILERKGYKVGLIGTIANYIGNKKLHSDRTTPESLELHKLFKDMVEEGVQYCVMEVSSHSLYLNRVYGIEFSQAIFTNLTQDHLDFHKTFENYYKAKLILFQNSKNNIVNVDSVYGKRIIEDIPSNDLTYAIDENADLKAENIEMHSRGISFDLVYKNERENIELNIPGRYNIMNALGVAGASLSEGMSLRDIKQGLESMECVPGRCEIVSKKYNLGFEIIVDYAHTPDGLQNILKTAREFTTGKLISVFGCGGDRDREKRPIMGDIGTNLSDIAIITSDNPRSEEPMDIIEDIIKGVKQSNYIIIENRRYAIKKAVEIAQKGDIIVIAGKGHEDYQIIKDKVIHFDEREVVEEVVKEVYNWSI